MNKGAICCSLLLIGILFLVGCAAKSSQDLLGNWKDTAVDKIPRLALDKREKMRMYLTLRSEGKGELSTGGVKAPFQWSEKNGKVEIVTQTPGGRGGQVMPFTLSPDRRRMNFAGNMEMVKQ